MKTKRRYLILLVSWFCIWNLDQRTWWTSVQSWDKVTFRRIWKFMYSWIKRLIRSSEHHWVAHVAWFVCEKYKIGIWWWAKNVRDVCWITRSTSSMKKLSRRTIPAAGARPRSPYCIFLQALSRISCRKEKRISSMPRWSALTVNIQLAVSQIVESVHCRQ